MVFLARSTLLRVRATLAAAFLLRVLVALPSVLLPCRRAALLRSLLSLLAKVHPAAMMTTRRQSLLPLRLSPLPQPRPRSPLLRNLLSLPLRSLRLPPSPPLQHSLPPLPQPPALLLVLKPPLLLRLAAPPSSRHPLRLPPRTLPQLSSLQLLPRPPSTSPPRRSIPLSSLVSSVRTEPQPTPPLRLRRPLQPLRSTLGRLLLSPRKTRQVATKATLLSLALSSHSSPPLVSSNFYIP
jgi:hypothetical protein